MHCGLESNHVPNLPSFGHWGPLTQLQGPSAMFALLWEAVSSSPGQHVCSHVWNKAGWPLQAGGVLQAGHCRLAAPGWPL